MSPLQAADMYPQSKHLQYFVGATRIRILHITQPTMIIPLLRSCPANCSTTSTTASLASKILRGMPIWALVTSIHSHSMASSISFFSVRQSRSFFSELYLLCCLIPNWRNVRSAICDSMRDFDDGFRKRKGLISKISSSTLLRVVSCLTLLLLVLHHWCPNFDQRFFGRSDASLCESYSLFAHPVVSSVISAFSCCAQMQPTLS